MLAESSREDDGSDLPLRCSSHKSPRPPADYALTMLMILLLCETKLHASASCHVHRLEAWARRAFGSDSSVLTGGVRSLAPSPATELLRCVDHVVPFAKTGTESTVLVSYPGFVSFKKKLLTKLLSGNTTFS